MKRKFELMAYGNASGYNVVLKIDDRAFEASKDIADDNIVENVYCKFTKQLKEVYSDLNTNPEYTDIRDARDQVYAIICALNKVCKGGAK